MNKKGTLLKEMTAIVRWQWERVNWTAVVAWSVGAVVGAVIYVGIAVLAVTAFSSCATQKEEHQHTTHVVEADTLSHQAQHDSHAQQQVADIDSIVTASIWAAMQEFVRQEQEHEVTTETLTETIDSLGRIIRQSQKTTDRTLSRQEIERQQEQLQQVANQLHQRLEVMDAEWHESLTRMEASLRDTLSAQIDKTKQTSAPQPLSWWQKLWQWLKGILVGIVIGILIACWRNVVSDFKRIVKGGINRFTGLL